ncbi:uncharacterized protein LOC130495483 [Raphanus sativus]|uniref:Uncharacterized protein LOC130495483 n=1 Tax=Raphanus sativus TaxID=3726 RepID=A0A9W3BUA8_RAPSA|nr:uncharacterized protein LOC130495483 [Raphanus sativus]
MEKLISENQSAFVPNRAIGDNVLITHEVLHFLKTSQAEQRCAMAVKTDMSKAYDRLEWDFIAAVLARLGFHRDLIGMIIQCISSVTYSFLINGLPRGKVVLSRGIRQGDPLSPYIFIMCSEVLSGLCNRAQEEGLIQGIKVARGCPSISHLLFADDTMFFLSANEANCDALKSILDSYESASGQSINRDKSAITFSKRAPATLKSSIMDKLQIQKEGGVGKYLGLPEHFGRRKRDLFSSIVDRIKQKARSWSTKFLSSARKLVMLQSVLSAMPSYSMTCFMLPKSLCKRLQSVVTRYWWDNKEGERKMAWVAWDKIATPKAVGGLGLRDFEKFNEALLAKIGWRLLKQPDCLLGKVLKGKYFPDSTILLAGETSTPSHGWRSALIGRDLLLKKIGWAVGNGQSINVWRDPWLSLTEQECPMGLPSEKYATLLVSDLLEPDSGNWDRELIQILFPEYESKTLCIKPSLTGAPDKLIWLGTKYGEYSSKSGYYTAIEDLLLEDPAEASFNWKKNVWALDVAPKVKNFSWKILKRAIPVGARLVERHIDTDPRCKRCGQNESITHMLFQCHYARKVWLLAPFTTDMDYSGIIDLFTDWPDLSAQKCLPPAGIATGSLFPWILWSLWKRTLSLWQSNLQGNGVYIVTQITQATSEERPPPPLVAPAGAVTVRSDAAWNMLDATAGLGWCLLTTPTGEDFRRRLEHVSSPLMAEGLALREAVLSCRSLQQRVLRFESDSSQLIKTINNQEGIAELHSVVSDILSLASEFVSVSFVWISKEKNSRADALAKSALIVVEPLVVEDALIAPN